ncbi:MAG: ribonuclease H [Desulfobacterales bacterium]
MTKNQQPTASEWKRMRFKNNKVWLAVDPAGEPIVQNDKMLIKYQLDQDYQYWVNPEAIRPLDSPATDPSEKQNKPSQDSAQKQKNQSPKTASKTNSDDKNAICIFTDGASSGNPGPSGIGVVMRYGKHQKEISEFIGTATNNIAELKAIEIGLNAVKNKDLPVKLYTDSNYAYGILALGWKEKKNKDIVASIKKIISKFKNLTFIKVKGHAGDEDNERADFLARNAISSGGIRK